MVKFITPLLAILLLIPVDAAAVGDSPLDELRRDLALAVRDQDEVRAVSVINDLAEIEDPDAIELITIAMVKIESKDLFDHGVETLAKLGSERLATRFGPLLAERKPNAEEVAVAMVVATQLEDERSEQWILDGLTHDLDLVVRLATDGAKVRRSKRAIPILIGILEKYGIGRGALPHLARQALISLVGLDLETPEDWRKYWDSNHASIDPENLDEDSTTGLELVQPDDTPQFFGLKIVSTNVAFVIDISGSMQKFDPGGEGGNSSWEVRQRITRTKRELGRAIQKLSKDSTFNIIAFNEEVERFQRKQVPAKTGAKRAAAGFLKKLVADRGTDTGLALREAFRDPRVDTIVLLSDGSPHTPAGEPRELIPRVEKLVRNLNRLRKIRIYTLGFAGEGEWPPGSKYRGQKSKADPAELESFLERLAESTGGKYTRID